MATDRRELRRAPQAQDQPSGIPAFWARSAEGVLAFALIPLPGVVVASRDALTLCYVIPAEVTKKRFFRAVPETAPQEWPAEFPDAARQQRRLARLAHEHGRPAGRGS